MVSGALQVHPNRYMCTFVKVIFHDETSFVT